MLSPKGAKTNHPTHLRDNGGGPRPRPLTVKYYSLAAVKVYQTFQQSLHAISSQGQGCEM